MREMGAMSQVMHPNIIKLYGLVQESKYFEYILRFVARMISIFITEFWLVIEYMSNGDLKHFLMVSFPFFCLGQKYTDLLFVSVDFFKHAETQTPNRYIGQVHDRCIHGNALSV